MPRIAIALLLISGMLCSVGCSDGGMTVNGTVTVNGEPLPVGHIGFAAADGKGPRVGGIVTNGSYSVHDLAPGKYQIIVTGHSGERPVITSREDAEKLRGKENKDLVAMDHPKNGQIVEVTAATSSLDFEY